MSRVLQLRPLITEVLSRSSWARQEPKLAAFGTKYYYACIKARLNVGPKILSSFTSNLHTSTTCLNQDPLQASPTGGESEGKHESSQFEEGVHEKIHEYQENHQTEATSDIDITGERRETVIDRLRRLSMTDADDYELSPMARKKALEMAKVRREMIDSGEQWKWDQRNIRPGGPPPQRYGSYNRNNDYGMRRNQNYDDEDDFESDRRWSRRDNFNDRRRESFRNYASSRYDDVGGDDDPENYEVEMQKLRERMAQNKSKRANAATSGDSENERFSIDNVASTSEHENSRVIDNSSFSNIKTSSSLSGRDNIDHSVDEHVERANSEFSPDHQVNFSLAESDPDSFGNLSFATSTLVKDDVGEEIRKELLQDEQLLSPLGEEEEEDDTRFIPPYGEKWTAQRLIRKVRDLLNEKKLTEAVDTYLCVLKDGGFKFDHLAIRHHFNVLINECANVGYVEMAFRLYNSMKSRGYKEKFQTISSLLNACANSPWDKEKNLDRIDKLLINMKDHGKELNMINYHALIKAYGRMGETVRAFNVVDKMIEESKMNPVTVTFNMLLQACISDTKNGFRFALITWRKMGSIKRTRPNIYTYNLLLRAIRDCGIELSTIELQQISDNSKERHQITSDVPLLPSIVTEEDSNRILTFLIPENPTAEETRVVLDNLGEPTIIDVKALMRALSYPTNRLAVLGGVKGIISRMAQHKVGPNLKTVTELMQVSRSTEIYDVLQLLNAYKIKPDIDFFNTTMERCFQLNEHRMAKDVLKLMNNVYHLTPNIETWDALAQGCQRWVEAKELLAEMDSTNVLPNIYILHSLLRSAVKNCDPKYVLHLIEETRKREISVNDKFLLLIDSFIKTTQRNLVSHEMGKQIDSKKFVDALERNPQLAESFSLLKMRFKQWIHSVDVKVYPENPWKAEFEHFREHKRHKRIEENDDLSESLMIGSAK